MSQKFHCPPSELWSFDASTPKGYYFNRGIFLWGTMVSSEMERAEAQARKNRRGKSADRLGNGARIGVLSKHLKENIRRFRDPATEKPKIKGDSEKDESITWKI